jgi:superfamily II DNA or RNA helicase
MINKLQSLLLRVPTDQLRVALGQELCAITELFGNEVTNWYLVNDAICAKGIALLSIDAIRFVLVTQKSESEIRAIATRLKIPKVNNTPLHKVADAIANLPFRDDERTLLLLEWLGFDATCLPKTVSLDFPTVEIVQADTHFNELLDYQFDLSQRILAIFKNEQVARCMAYMPTGSGKTKTAMHILKSFWVSQHQTEGTVIWLAPTKELLDQAIDSFEKCWRVLGNRDVTLVRFWDKHEMPEDLPHGTIIFAGVQKIISFAKNQSDHFLNICRDIRLVVFDEAHKCPADKTREVIEELMRRPNGYANRCLLGLSATPGRSNTNHAANFSLLDMFENNIVGISTELMKQYHPSDATDGDVIRHLQQRQVLARFARQTIEISSEELGLNERDLISLKRCLEDENDGINADLLRKIAASKTRNEKIIRKVQDVINQGCDIIIFACSKDHSDFLSAVLNKYGIKSASITGATPAAERQAAIAAYQDRNNPLRVLVNFGVLTTGFDAKNTTCVFIARPVGSLILYSQMIGRGIRGPLMGGNAECILVDVVDNLGFGDEQHAFKSFARYWQ